MQGYVLLVTPQQQHALSEAGVRAAHLTVDGQDGLAIPVAQVDNVLEILNATVRKKVASQEYEGVFLVTLKTRDPDATYVETVVTSWDGKSKDSFVDIADEILGSLLHDQGFGELQIHVPHKKVAKPIDDGNFHIQIWSAPAKCTMQTMPEKVWDIPVSCTDDAFTPSGDSVKFVDDSIGYTVAELVNGNNLYILHDIVHKGSKKEQALFRKLLSMVAEFLRLDEKGRQDFIDARAKQAREASAKEYVRYCAGRIDTEVKRYEGAAEEARNNLTSLQEQLAEAMEKTRDAEALLDKLRARQDNQDEALRREFELLFEAPEVLDLRVLKDRVLVFTDTLYATDDRDGQEYEIGKFRIELYFGVNNGNCVRWFNLDRLVKASHTNGNPRYFNAPHVSEDGAGCLGNMGDRDNPKRGLYVTLLRELKLHQAVLMAIEFPKAVNTSDAWGKNIVKWPKSTRKEES